MQKHPVRQSQRGTSLIEVLVAVLLLSIGLLAMAGIHASSLRFSKMNQFKGSAGEIAQMVAEAARGNIQGALQGGYTVAGTGGAITAPGTLCVDVAAPCTAVNTAAVDIFTIRTAARASLPVGDVFTTLNVTPAGTTATLSVWVHWVTPQTDNTANAADRALYDAAQETCPAAVAALTPRRQCLLYTLPL